MIALNKIIKLFLTSFLFILLVACSTATTNKTYLDVDYDDFVGQFIETPEEQLNMPQDDYYIYYYGPYCGGCNYIKAELLDTLYRAKNTTIYFVTVTNISDISESSGVNGTPTIIRVTNNEVSEFYEGSESILSMLDQIT